MPTIIAVRKNGFACIGADTLSIVGGSRKLSAEHIVNHEQIISFGTNYIGILAKPALRMAVDIYFEKKKKYKLDSPQAIFDELCSLHITLKERFYLNPREDENDPFESSRFSSLIINPYGIFKTYELRSVQCFTKFYAIGSGSSYALGALEALYDRINSSEEIVKRALEIAAEFDDSTGLPGTFHKVKLK